MAKTYIALEGEVTALNTKTQLTQRGSEGTVSPINVPAGCSRLESIFVCCASNYAAVASAAAFLRIEGKGITGGVREVVIGAFGGESTTGNSALNPIKAIPVNIPVVPTNAIAIYAEFVGEDIGAFIVGVTLVFT